MSDFTSNFWAIFVASITVIGMLACLLLLWFSGKARAMTANDNTTGHVWDGDLREMNNPLPRWWVWLFVITVVFGFVYLALYPGLGKSAGQLGWTSASQYEAEVQKANLAEAPLYARFMAMAPEAVAKDPQAHAIGERLFMNNCAQCHGSDAHGSKGFPNLTDSDWLYGGSPENIKTTITNGRGGVMPPFGAVLNAGQVQDVANYVRSLSGLPADDLKAARGAEVFKANCVACHGADAKGNIALGSPNLTDKTWLYGSSEATIVETVTKGRTAMMPAQDKVLSPEKIQLLTAYVWGLSNNKPAPVAQ